MSISQCLASLPRKRAVIHHQRADTADNGHTLPRMLALRVALLAFVALLPSISVGFVNGDDEVNFLENLGFRGLGWEQLRWAWSTMLVGVYQPVAWMLLEAQYAAWGLDPRGYHYAGLALHALNTAVLFALTVALVDRARPTASDDERRRLYWASALAAALFAVHPLRAEVVSWTSCQPYLPCAFFSMLTILAYLHAQQKDRSVRSRTCWLVGTFVLYAAAFLSKAPAVGLPVVLLILDVYPLGRFGPRALLEKVPFFAASAGAMVMAVHARESLSASIVYPLSFRIGQASFGAVFYLVKTIVPTGLTAFYPFPLHPNWAEPRFVASIVLVVAATAAALWFWRRAPGLSAAWLAYLVLLAPSSGLVPMGRAMTADRYSYLAMMAWSAPLAVGFSWLFARAGWSRRGMIGLWGTSVAVLLGLAVLSWYQCATWHSSEMVWTNALEHGGEDSSDIHNNLGTAYAQLGLFGDAAYHFDRAIAIDPNQASIRNNLGMVLCNLGKPDAAIPHLFAAIQLKPNSALAYNNLGMAYFRKNKPAEAAFFYCEAARLKPNSPEIRNNLGATLLEQGKPAEAAAEFRAALEIRPSYEKAQRNLKNALASLAKRPSSPAGPTGEALSGHSCW
jgi:Tfp pilus assembly protein PilF